MLQSMHDFRQCRGRHIAPILFGRGPHEGDRFRQIAHKIIGHFEQNRIGAFSNQSANDGRLGMSENQSARHGSERQAPFGIWRLAKIIGEQAQLVIARGLIGEPVEKLRENIHASSCEASMASSSP